MTRRIFPRPLFGKEKREAKKVQPPLAQPASVQRVEEAELPVGWGRIIFVSMEVTAFSVAIIGIPMLIVDLGDRQDDRITRAWQLITAPAPGNSGKGSALEYLNSEDHWFYGNSSFPEYLYQNHGEDSWFNQWSPEWAKQALSAFLPLKKRIRLTGVNLSAERHGEGGVDVRFTNLRGANLMDVNFEKALFGGANLSGANLVRANLSDVNFYGADLSGSNLNSTVLIGANLDKSNLSKAHISNANLREAVMRHANLREVDFRRSQLVGADLRFSDLTDAKFNGANLSDAKFSVRNLSTIECNQSWYWEGRPLKGEFPCKPYKVEEGTDTNSSSRVYLHHPIP